MLYRYLIIFSLVCMGFASCETEPVDDNKGGSGKEEQPVVENFVTSIRASFLQNSTKAEMYDNASGQMKYYWNNYDAIELINSSTTVKYLYRGTDKV